MSQSSWINFCIKVQQHQLILVTFAYRNLSLTRNENAPYSILIETSSISRHALLISTRSFSRSHMCWGGRYCYLIGRVAERRYQDSGDITGEFRLLCNNFKLMSFWWKCIAVFHVYSAWYQMMKKTHCVKNNINIYAMIIIQLKWWMHYLENNNSHW